MQVQPKKPLKRQALSPHSSDILAKCGFYLSSPFTGSAATRGLRLNDYLVQRFTPEAKTPEVPADMRGAYDWGVARTLEFAAGHPVLVSRKDCRITIPGVDRPGYCDLVIPSRLTSLDWKSGMRRSHRLQHAFYALGQMLDRWAVSWTCASLFLDDQETEFHRFTMDEATALVAESRAAYDMPEAPRINENCNWCANFFECPTQLALAGKALQQISENALDWPQIINDPKQLSQFLLGCSSLKEFEKEARSKGREFFFQKVEVPGFRLSNGKRSWSLPVETLLDLVNRGDLMQQNQALRKAVEILGHMSKEEYFQLCSALGLSPDETLLKVAKGDPYITKK